MSHAADQILIQRLVIGAGIVCFIAGIALFFEARWLLVVGETTAGQVIDQTTSYHGDGIQVRKHRPIIRYTVAGNSFRHHSSQSYRQGSEPARGARVDVYYRESNPSYSRTRDEMGIFGARSLIAYALLALGAIVAGGGGPAVIAMLGESEVRGRYVR